MYSTERQGKVHISLLGGAKRSDVKRCDVGFGSARKIIQKREMEVKNMESIKQVEHVIGIKELLKKLGVQGDYVKALLTFPKDDDGDDSFLSEPADGLKIIVKDKE